MERFSAYSLPIQGLKVGSHHFKYALDQEFFRHFEGSPIEEANIEVEVLLDKRSDMMVFDFSVAGTVKAECDRCTATIDLPVEDEQQLIVKFGEPDPEDDEDDEVVFIPREAPEFNLARYLYEFSVMALPITNTYDCDSAPNPPCNFEVLNYLKQTNEDAPSTADPTWDALQDLKDN